MLGSCLKEPAFHGYQVRLFIDFGSDFPPGEKEGTKVVLTNQTRNYTLQDITDSDGFVRFSPVEPGFYRATVSRSFGRDGKAYDYNGTKNIDIFGNVTDTIDVKGTPSNAFVIREIYFSGSTTPAGKKYPADQYLELFNNTNEIQYADGISVLIHESSNAGPNRWENLKDTMVAEMIWTIPGNGTQVPVEPGKSIVIAQDGINHRSDPNGNPLSPVNLGDADFEFYVYKYNGTDVDSPWVPNMIRDYTPTDILEVSFDVRGGSAIAIAKLPGQTDQERQAYINRHLVPKPSVSGSSTSYYPKIADKYILDAVETVRDEAHAIYKRFTPDLDAGYTYITTGSYSGKCVRRKIQEITAGRVIYQDTNNSTDDFLKDVDPKPKIYE
jgi:hypothetical protein